ncbi:mandelate racemase/muconate lactonizing enzyme family protein [bacterium]|nr:mandelate racemase/muconate lactonizing enzyme family protein [bacterium]
MRIDRIETFLLKAPLEGSERFYSSQAPFSDRNSLIVRITTDDGLVGWGESGISMPLEHVQTYIHDVLASRILGKSALETEPLWDKLYAFSRDFGRKATPVDALSGIDIALWDIRGKDAGKPVHALMGDAFRQTVRAYATGLYYREDDLNDPKGAADRVGVEAAAFRDAGFSAIKGKIGLLSARDDIRRMQAVREAVGRSSFSWRMPNHAYNRHTARTVGNALHDLGFLWFEEPLVPEDIDGCAALRREADISACGGLSEGQKILALSTSFHTPLCLHVWGSGVVAAAALQLTAMIPPIPYTFAPRAPENAPMFEYDRTRNPLRDDLVTGGFQIENETLAIPQGPGLGIEIDPDVLKRFTWRKGESVMEC